MLYRRKLTLPFRLAGRNEYIQKSRSNKYAAASLKSDEMTAIAKCLYGFRPIRTPCVIAAVFTESNRRRDVDNVESAIKTILDALQKCGALENDNPRHVIAAPTWTQYGDSDSVTITVIEGDSGELCELIRKTRKEVTGE